MIGQGRLDAFTARIAPFRDRPGLTIPWLFYRTSGPGLPFPTRFQDTFWDRQDRLDPVIPGIVQGSERPYFGPIPPDALTEIRGSEDEWLNGLLFSDYEAGRVLPPGLCWPLGPPVSAKLRQKESIDEGV